jgi:DHA1 family inner membrane transport protein
VGGAVIARGVGLANVPLAAAGLALLALIVTFITFRRPRTPDLAPAA